MNQTNDHNRAAVEYVRPRVNIGQTSDGYVLEADMPGVGKEGLDVTVHDGELVITGHRRVEKSAACALHCEARSADFRRAFELGPEIDATRISARLDRGVLTLHLPKAEALKPRKIAVS